MPSPFRPLLFAAVLAACAAAPFAAVPAGAQNVDVIKERQALMKKIGGAAKAGGQMLKGDVAYDPAKGAEIFETMNTSIKAFATKFPEDSKTGGDTEASPAIWEKPDEFKAKIAKFESDTGAALAAKPQTVEDFKVAFGTVTQNCKSCHQAFRVDK